MKTNSFRTAPLNDREKYLFEKQDEYPLKELAGELSLSVSCTGKMLVRVNKFMGRTQKKKRICLNLKD